MDLRGRHADRAQGRAGAVAGRSQRHPHLQRALRGSRRHRVRARLPPRSRRRRLQAQDRHLSLRARQVLAQVEMRRRARVRHRRLCAVHHPAPRHRLAGGGRRGGARETSATPAALAQDTPAPSPRTCGAGSEPMRIAAPPLDAPPPADVRRNVRWVKPALVAEVELRGWTADGIVRHAVFKGLRPEKDTADVVQPKRCSEQQGSAGAAGHPHASRPGACGRRSASPSRGSPSSTPRSGRGSHPTSSIGRWRWCAAPAAWTRPASSRSTPGPA